MRDPATFGAFYSSSVRGVTGQLYAMTGSRGPSAPDGAAPFKLTTGLAAAAWS